MALNVRGVAAYPLRICASSLRSVAEPPTDALRGVPYATDPVIALEWGQFKL